MMTTTTANLEEEAVSTGQRRPEAMKRNITKNLKPVKCLSRYAAKAQKIWGPGCIVLPVEGAGGPFAVISFCGAVIISLHPDFGAAWKVKEHLDGYGCCPPQSTRRCRVPHVTDEYERHAIFDLRTPFVRLSDGVVWLPGLKWYGGNVQANIVQI